MNINNTIKELEELMMNYDNMCNEYVRSSDYLFAYYQGKYESIKEAIAIIKEMSGE